MISSVKHSEHVQKQVVLWDRNKPAPCGVYPEPQAERYGTIDPERIPVGRMSRRYVCESGDIRSDKDVYEVTSDVLEHDQTWGRYQTGQLPRNVQIS
jgi:hypothetical protein